MLKGWRDSVEYLKENVQDQRWQRFGGLNGLALIRPSWLEVSNIYKPTVVDGKPRAMLTHIYSLCNAAVQTCSNHRLARSEFVHGPNLVSEPCQSLLGPRNAEFSSL